MSIINPSSLSISPTKNQLAPCEGPKSIEVPLDFTTSGEYTLDYQNQELLSLFTQLQGIYFDNAVNGSSVTLLCSQTRQRITCPSLSQGYAPLLCGKLFYLTFTSSGSALVTVHLCNFPVPVGFWKV